MGVPSPTKHHQSPNSSSSRSDSSNNNNNNNDDASPVVAAVDGTTSASAEGGDVLPPRPLMRNRLNDEKKEGELPFDKLIVAGTLSLGLLMFIGGLVILIITLVDQSSFKDASVDDFQSLGPQACQILSTVNYEIETQELDALNSRCYERYQYEVQIVGNGQESAEATFTSTVLSKMRCQTKCDICPEQFFFGQDHYVGVDVTRLGEPISDDTLVECWAPTKPISQLSDFYDCGKESGDGVTNPKGATQCFQLIDTSIELEDVQNSNDAGMIAAIVGLVGSVVLTCWGGYFVYRNRQARSAHEQKQLLTEGKNIDDEGAFMSGDPSGDIEQKKDEEESAVDV